MDAERPSVYRAAAKLQRLQRLCHLDAVHVGDVALALRSVGGALSREDVTRAVRGMFDSASHDLAGHLTAPEEAANLMFTLFDRGCRGAVAARSLHATATALCADRLPAKLAGLLSLADGGSGRISRAALRTLLQDLSQIPVAVQEEGVFGGVEAAVASCFHGVTTPTASQPHVLAWLQREPRLLLWLPALCRLTLSHGVTHDVRCHSCRTAPISGLRFRCLKCVNVHVCLSCFLSRRQTRKHRECHPVQEFCTQPSWRESVASLLQNTRHALLPRRVSQRSADRRVPLWAEPAEGLNRDGPPSEDASPPPAGPSPDGHAVLDASTRPPSRQTGGALEQASALLSDVRDLQRDKRLMEEELQAWRSTIQSEQEALETRCSEMAVTMETLRQHNVQLQDMLSQTLKERDSRWATPPPDAEEEEEEEELMKITDGWSHELQTPSPSSHQHWPASHDGHFEEDSAGDECLSSQIRLEREEEEEEEEEEVDREEEERGEEKEEVEEEEEEEEVHREEEEEGPGTRGVKAQLQETACRLKTLLGTDSWTGVGKKAELVDAAEQLGDSILLLVDRVK